MTGQKLKGHLDMLLLACLRQGPKHGYAVIEDLHRRSGGQFDLPEGTVYPALHRLERSSCVSSRWVDAAGRRRRTYKLTRKGLKALADKQQEWLDFADAVSAIVERPA